MTRNILASVLVIGVAAAMLGAGTMAYFSDTETVGVHDIQAGTLNLQVGSEDPCTEHITFTNIAPGVYKEPVYKVKNIGTIDGKLSIEFSEIVNKEHGRTEPEIAAEDAYGPLDGELGEHLLFRFRREYPNKKWICMNAQPLNNYGVTNWSTIDGEPMILHPGDEWGIQLRFTLPDNTGNIIQSDSVEFDIIFHLEQA